MLLDVALVLVIVYVGLRLLMMIGALFAREPEMPVKRTTSPEELEAQTSGELADIDGRWLEERRRKRATASEEKP